MVKLILLPKFDLQCAKRIARDTVAKRMLPIKPLKGFVRIAICQDGRVRRSDLQYEMEYFQALYKKYLDQPDIQVFCYVFSFLGGALPVFFLYGFCSLRRPPARTRRPPVPPARLAALTLQIWFGYRI